MTDKEYIKKLEYELKCSKEREELLKIVVETMEEVEAEAILRGKYEWKERDYDFTFEDSDKWREEHGIEEEYDYNYDDFYYTADEGFLL